MKARILKNKEIGTIIEKKPAWYVVYTKSRHEKKVSDEFLLKNIEHYLPVQRVIKQWHDRKKWIIEPVFKSYIFVRLGLIQYNETLNVDGVVGFVRFGSRPEPVLDIQVESIRKMLESGEEVTVDTENYNLGEEIMIKRGPMAGLQGNLIQLNGRHKVVIHIAILGKNLSVNVAKNNIKRLSQTDKPLNSPSS